MVVLDLSSDHVQYYDVDVYRSRVMRVQINQEKSDFFWFKNKLVFFLSPAAELPWNNNDLIRAAIDLCVYVLVSVCAVTQTETLFIATILR